jgi:putative N6-adenine-specific DNA methylase
MKLVIRTLKGLEQVLAAELLAIGCTEIEILTRAVACEATQKQMYACNYLLRTAIKVMIPLPEVKVENETQLYNAAKNIPWENYFGVDQTFAVDGVVNSDIFRHSKYVALKTKDAIADRFREKMGKRPFVNPVNPDVNIICHIRNNILTLLMDSSGASLHMRGYRAYLVDAPINEVLAAGMIGLSGWDKQSTLVDPMCGSGTIAIEAALMAANMPPQVPERKYCFMNWKDYNSTEWNEVLDDAESKIDKSKIPSIYAYDKSLQSVSATKTNAAERDLQFHIIVDRKDFFNSDGMENVTIITNPPYDERLREDDIIQFYKDIGDTLKKKYINTAAWIICGNLTALKMLGLKPSKKIPLLNGDIESGFYKFDIYEGSKKHNRD